MAQAIIGIFESSSEAEKAKQALLENGFNNDAIAINDRVDTVDELVTDGQMTDTTEKSANPVYEVLEDQKKTGSMVTVQVQYAGEVLIATDILNDMGAMDINEFSES